LFANKLVGLSSKTKQVKEYQLAALTPDSVSSGLALLYFTQNGALIRYQIYDSLNGDFEDNGFLRGLNDDRPVISGFVSPNGQPVD